MYHDVIAAGESDASGFPGGAAAHYKLDERAFASHLAALAASGLQFDAVSTPVADATCLLSFDDGGASAVAIGEALDHHAMRGHFFITTSHIGQRGFVTSQDLRTLHAGGHVVGSHSHTHPAEISRLTAGALDAEWRISVDCLNQHLGAPITVASVPGGFYAMHVAQAAAAVGIRYLFTSEPTQTLEEGSRQMALSNYSEKLIEQKERELRESIAANYSRMRGVEKELSNLQLQLKLTAGPKRLALEMYRKKIEVQNEKVAGIKLRHTAAKRALEAIDAELRQEEASKAELCDALNTLVQQSALLQLNKLEELKQHLDSLARGVTGEGSSPPHHPLPPPQQRHQRQAVGASPASAAAAAAAHSTGANSTGAAAAHSAGANSTGAYSTGAAAAAHSAGAKTGAEGPSIVSSGAQGADTISLTAMSASNPFLDRNNSGTGAASHLAGANAQGVSPQLTEGGAAGAAGGAAAASAAAVKATAAAARARHVSIRPKPHVAASPAGTGTEPSPVKAAQQQQQQQGAGQRGGGAKFDGFDA
ncbi:MAG: hypothetical protein WDW36_003328 [Sanguina aurantia]